jgi:hypothetical protein
MAIGQDAPVKLIEGMGRLKMGDSALRVTPLQCFATTS